MKKALCIAIASLGLFAAGCNEGEDTLTTQQTAIVRYLTSTRRMVSLAEVGDVIEDNPPFYTEHGRSAYRHIANYYDAGRDNRTEVVPGSTVEIHFNAYVFNGSEPSLTSVYWSNIPATIRSLEAGYANPYDDLAWSTEPLVIKLGSTNVIKGLEESLVGCRDKDSVQIYMTYNLAYGKKLLGTVPKNSSVAWYIKILNVTK